MFETLQNFAEVSIAVAGFSGIAATLGAASRGSWKEEKRRFFEMLLETRVGVFPPDLSYLGDHLFTQRERQLR